MKIRLTMIAALSCCLLLSACGGRDTATAPQTSSASSKSESKVPTSSSSEEKEDDDTPETLTFRDVYGTSYEVEINQDVPATVFDKDSFVHDGDRLTYDDGTYTSQLGVDVSGHQGNIDWKKVKEWGADFAIIRIGYRGYGKTGNLCVDNYAVTNLKNAKAAGLDVGVYFFSQAINEDEAIAEADLAVKTLEGMDLDLPVCFDPENILNDDENHTLNKDARSSSVTPEQFTKNSVAFCKHIKEAGYKPMVYANMLWEAYQLDLSQLPDIPVWYADYEDKPQTPYAYEFWQYSNEGQVPGISGACDLDIRLIRK